MSKVTESHLNSLSKSVSIRSIRRAYENKQKLTMLTCYDYSFAKLINRCDVDMVLVGDSLGNVMLGFENTLEVTVEQVALFTSAVKRGLTRGFLIADMPFFSYSSSSVTLKNVEMLIRAGAQAVKLEGGEAFAPTVHQLVELGVPVVGHIGFTPQSIHKLGGYRVQGRIDQEAEQLKRSAKALADAGAFCIVLELVPAEIAKAITESIAIPTIGIGAGPHCSGQVLVLQDLLGFDSESKLKHVKPYAELDHLVTNAVRAYVDDVRSGQFPGVEQSF